MGTAVLLRILSARPSTRPRLSGTAVPWATAVPSRGAATRVILDENYITPYIIINIVKTYNVRMGFAKTKAVNLPLVRGL
jgi:hypothetical protein